MKRSEETTIVGRTQHIEYHSLEIKVFADIHSTAVPVCCLHEGHPSGGLNAKIVSSLQT